MKVLFVCYGNICRSPTAHGVFEAFVQKAGLDSKVLVDSGGTSGYHEGDPPDERSQLHARKRGFDLSRLRSKPITPEMLAGSDYVLAMDRANIEGIQRVCPPEHRRKVQLFLDYAPEQSTREVPDPYYGGTAGFERVLDLVEEASRGLLTHVEQRLRV
jgi:protein-tyrosine phosphatase